MIPLIMTARYRFRVARGDHPRMLRARIRLRLVAAGGIAAIVILAVASPGRRFDRRAVVRACDSRRTTTIGSDPPTPDGRTECGRGSRRYG